MTRACYSVLKITPGRIYIADIHGPRSVTNDAEAVVDELVSHFGLRRVFYYDSMSFLDEITLDADGKFNGFRCVSDIERREHESILNEVHP